MTDRDSSPDSAEEHADWATTRIGLAAHGFYYLVLALLMGRLAFGGSDGGGAQGAFAAIARQPFGQVLLAPLVLAFALYAGHHAMAAWREDDWAPRVAAGIRSLVWTGMTILSGRTWLQGVTSSGGGGGGSTSATKRVLDLPGGTWIVAGAGLVVVGIAVWQGYQAQSSGLASELTELEVGEERAARILGRVGYAGRALAYAVTGGVIVHAAVTRDPSEAGGLDRALSQLRETTAGPPILLVIAVGFAAFALFRFVEARYRGLD